VLSVLYATLLKTYIVSASLSSYINRAFTYYMSIVKMVHHHQPINVPIPGAQAFLMDYQEGEQAITDWWVRMDANTVGAKGLTCLPKHGGARVNKYLVTHPMSDQCCLASAIIHREH
jgi:hypothetical protein